MNYLKKRRSGILLHISSLPGNTGIGTLGKNARKFIDLLSDAGQNYWQILPVGPTSYGDSPYQSFSTFAGNPYFIDLDTLADQGYLSRSDYENIVWGENEASTDYSVLYHQRTKVFKILHENFKNNIPSDYEKFVYENSDWLEDYALFMAVKDVHGGKPFDQWEDNIRFRKAVPEWKSKCKNEIEYYKMLQYFFFKQWFDLKEYANQHNIRIIGDIPIYVSRDSADVWASPEQFFLDEKCIPIEVAGCPPDGFSADGQLWGNPVYNWDYMNTTGYQWWKKRISSSLKIYDILRIDHFRGFDSYYCIPYGSPNAQNGHWRQGPGMHFFNELKETIGDKDIIAEDLGFLTDSVKKLLNDSGFPGMKVLQFAFDSREESDYLPFNYNKHSVVYTGTHDNDTINGWTETAGQHDVENAKEYLRCDVKAIREEMMCTALSSISNTCILTMQDLIGLGSEARMNKPSTLGNNWKWRCTEKQLNSENLKFLKQFTEVFGRRNRF